MHQARTVCRRAERELFALSRVEPVGEWPLRYVNRLSDLLFVLGRFAPTDFLQHLTVFVLACFVG